MNRAISGGKPFKKSVIRKAQAREPEESPIGFIDQQTVLVIEKKICSKLTHLGAFLSCTTNNAT